MDNKISSKNPDLQNTERLRREFVHKYDRYTIEKLSVEDYAMGKGDKDNFCYWLEIKLSSYGNINGCYISRYGVWFSKETKNFKCSKKFGNTPIEAMSSIRKEIIDLLDAGEKGDYSAIRKSKISSLMRYKLLAIYYPDKVFSVYSINHLSYFCKKAGMEILDGDDELTLQAKLVQWKETNPIASKMDMLEFANYLYNHFGHPPKTDLPVSSKTVKNRLKQELEKFDKDHLKKVLTKVEVKQRSDLVRRIVKEKAGGICQLCNKPAPFFTKDGYPFLECHHVIWLKNQGPDEVSNVVALCPNCHRKMHYLNEEEDFKTLKRIARKNNA